MSSSSASAYIKGGLDTNDILKAKLDAEWYEGYCIGTIHKRLHEAAALHRTDPQGRRHKYEAVLFYIQQAIQRLGSGNLSANPDNVTSGLGLDLNRMNLGPDGTRIQMGPGPQYTPTGAPQGSDGLRPSQLSQLPRPNQGI